MRVIQFPFSWATVIGKQLQEGDSFNSRPFECSPPILDLMDVGQNVMLSRITGAGSGVLALC